uniref:Uncharacterized protein n=1 Tax=Lotus japonicus TaxID=34305 RepID=I3RZ78_LOTJA|nr:unknown [Lotus japonicus]
MSASIKAEEGKDMNVKAITHRFMFLIVHMKELNIRIHLSQLTNLRMKSFAATTTRREEINNHKLIPCVQKGEDLRA